MLFATAAAPAVASPTGGADVPDDPRVRSLACMPAPEKPCPASGAVVAGGRLAISGSELEATQRVVFRGRRGRADDIEVRPKQVERRRIEVAVPAGAQSGPVVVVSSLGAAVRAPDPVRIVEPPRPEPVDTAPGGAFFFAGQQKPVFAFESRATGPVRVELVRESDGAVVRSWELQGEAGQRQEVRWDGRSPAGAEGTARYRFRIADGTQASAQSEDAFSFYDHIFPIRAKHNLGYTDTNNFGGGRGHQGQDMFARCGAPIAAARGGVVKAAAYHSRAGNYLVIDGAGTDQDYAYMHMRLPTSVVKGERVFTGQKVGEVGESGRASGCHLHFELWKGPWYGGGNAIDPLPQLKLWDAYS